jgi:hypothetical protein
MKLIRLGSTLLVLALALGFSIVSVPAQEEEEVGGGDPPKCDCRYPNPPQEYGVKSGGTCVVTDCWIDVT